MSRIPSFGRKGVPSLVTPGVSRMRKRRLSPFLAYLYGPLPSLYATISPKFRAQISQSPTIESVTRLDIGLDPLYEFFPRPIRRSGDVQGGAGEGQKVVPDRCCRDVLRV